MIDAHHHLWKYSAAEYGWMNDAMRELKRDYLPGDLKREMDAAGVRGAVTVQARQSLEETRWLLDLASQHEFLLGVVGWVPLIEPDVAKWLEKFTEFPKLRGVRHVLQDEADDDYMLRPDFQHGIAQLRGFGLVYDILIHERHLPQTIRFVDRNPNQVFVLDHIAKPRISDGALSPWRENLTELAKRENVWCKLSGMATEADWNGWSEATLEPYFAIAYEAFGPERLMFGSDWPVLRLAGEYGPWAEMVTRWVRGDRRILGENAARAYGLGLQSSQ